MKIHILLQNKIDNLIVLGDDTIIFWFSLKNKTKNNFFHLITLNQMLMITES